MTTAATRRLPGGSTPPPDLEIRVTVETRGGETRLAYLLHSSSDRLGFHYHTIPGQPIRSRPEDYQTALLKAIDGLQAGICADGSRALENEVADDLAALGRKLYRELFPPEMRAAYRAFRGVVDTLLITSDEPWIPWELVRPYDDGPPEPIDDDFLCSSFRLTRWLTGERGPADAIGVERLACIAAGEVPGEKTLPHAGEELRWLRELAGRHRGIDDRSLPRAAHPEVKARLEKEGIDLVHFVGHGRFDEADPDQSGFLLEDGRSLRPLDLFHGRIRTQVRGRRPLVFLNACQVAQQSYSLTGLGGWAPRWIGDCGCGAFVAPLWTVDDRLAYAFATTFYGALEGGRTFGEAARTARHRVRELDPSRPTWLAFTIYAHPNGRLVLGRRRETPSEEVFARSSDAATAMPPVLIDSSGVEQGDTRSRNGQNARRRFLAGLVAAAGLLAILVAVSLVFAEKWRGLQRQGIETSTQVVPEIEIPVAGHAGSAEGEPSLDSPPPPPVIEKARRVDQPKQSPPLLPLASRRVGIAVLDRKTRQPDADVADAIETLLSTTAEDIVTTVPQVDVEYVERLLDGDFSSLPADGRAPWGVESLLIATVSRKEVPQTNPNLEGVVLTLRAQLVVVGSRSTRLRSTETHTGLGPTSEAALLQAAERCLREIVKTLTGENSHEAS
jgi:hypothetical protein